MVVVSLATLGEQGPPISQALSDPLPLAVVPPLPPTLALWSSGFTCSLSFSPHGELTVP